MYDGDDTCLHMEGGTNNNACVMINKHMHVLYRYVTWYMIVFVVYHRISIGQSSSKLVSNDTLIVKYKLTIFSVMYAYLA